MRTTNASNLQAASRKLCIINIQVQCQYRPSEINKHQQSTFALKTWLSFLLRCHNSVDIRYSNFILWKPKVCEYISNERKKNPTLFCS